MVVLSLEEKIREKKIWRKTFHRPKTYSQRGAKEATSIIFFLAPISPLQIPPLSLSPWPRLHKINHLDPPPLPFHRLHGREHKRLVASSNASSNATNLPPPSPFIFQHNFHRTSRREAEKKLASLPSSPTRAQRNFPRGARRSTM